MSHRIHFAGKTGLDKGFLHRNEKERFLALSRDWWAGQ